MYITKHTLCYAKQRNSIHFISSLYFVFTSLNTIIILLYPLLGPNQASRETCPQLPHSRVPDAARQQADSHHFYRGEWRPGEEGERERERIL